MTIHNLNTTQHRVRPRTDFTYRQLLEQNTYTDHGNGRIELRLGDYAGPDGQAWWVSHLHVPDPSIAESINRSVGRRGQNLQYTRWRRRTRFGRSQPEHNFLLVTDQRLDCASGSYDPFNETVVSNMAFILFVEGFEQMTRRSTQWLEYDDDLDRLQRVITADYAVKFLSEYMSPVERRHSMYELRDAT